MATPPPRNTEEWFRWVERRLGHLDRHRHPEAFSTAEVAQETAVEAGVVADQAQQDAADAVSRVDGKTTNFYQEDPPPAEGRTEGDVWVRTSDQELHFWYGEWVPVSQLGGTSIFYGPDTPTATGVGDLWLKQPENIAHRWDGDSWEPVRDQGIVQALEDALLAQQIAESKAKITDSPTPPADPEVGDYWRNTADGNRLYQWGTEGTVERRNSIINGSFEYDEPYAATSTTPQPTGWMKFSGGAAASATYAIHTASGLPAGGQYGRIIAPTLGTTGADYIGIVQDLPAAPGDVIYARASLWVGGADTGKPVRFVANWLDAVGGAFEAMTVIGTGNTGYQHLVGDSTARPAPAGTTKVRIYLYRTGGGAAALANADLRMDAVSVEFNRPAGVANTYFDGDSEDAAWEGLAHLSPSITWVPGTATLGWQPRLLRNGAIQPKSLVAHDVIATGTVSAALLEATLILATTIIAGDPNGTHARMAPTGFRAYLADPGGGAPDEVVRLGTDTDDTIGVVGTPTGATEKQLLATIDRTGMGSFRKVVTREWPTIDAEERPGVPGGTLLQILNRRARGLVGWGARYSNAPSTNTTGGVGVFEIRVRLYWGRMYKVCTSVLRVDSSLDSELVEVQTRITRSSTTPLTQQTPTTPPATPTITSEILGRAHGVVGRPGAAIEGVQVTKLYALGDVETNYVDARILLTYSRAIGSGTLTMQGHPTSGDVIEMWVEDIGPFMGNLQVTNTGGGGAITTPTRFNETFTPAWTTTWKDGGGTVRFHQNEMIQGRAPDGANGVQMAAVGWDQGVTNRLAGATIESVGLYMYATHWYYNAGGTVILGRHSHAGVGGGPATWQSLPRVENMRQFHLDKPGGAWVDAPEGKQGWADGTVRGYCIGGPTGSDLNYYGRLAGWNQPNQPLINITYTKVV